ncbi:hypothetical protein LCL87_07380 [Rhodococcus hoagii]|nr:hypothetical protein [Prescottella equi]
MAIPLGSSGMATAAPVPPAPFQVPVTFVSACSTVGFICWVPNKIAAVTPSSVVTAPGVVTFAAAPSATVVMPISTLDCIDVSIAWRNLATGATGDTVLRAQPTIEAGRPLTPDELCRYVPATAATGRGTVVASADVSNSVHPPRSDLWPQVQIHAGFGVLEVP